MRAMDGAEGKRAGISRGPGSGTYRHGNRSAVRYLGIVCMAAGIWWATAMVSYADEAIKSVTIAVTSSIEAYGDGGSVSATADSTKYHVVSCDFINGKSQWKAGDIPKASIELAAEEGYYFNSISSSGAHIRGADYVTSKKSDAKRSLTITVKLKGIRGTLDRVEDAYWEEKPLGKARWAKVEGASSYEVKLFCDESMVYHVPRTNSVSYDFFPYMTDEGDYYFKVRAVAKTESEADYLKAGDWTESDNQEITRKDAQAADKRATSTGKKGVSVKDGTGPRAQAPGWVQDANGWWYKNEDGSYPVGNWKAVGDKWYLFDMNGYMLTGWQWKNDKEYYLTTNGDMVTGWFQYNRIWYYLDPEQGKLTGRWLQDGGKWYYLNPDGSMATGWLLNQGSWYYMDPRNGQMVTDQMVGEYYINHDGIWNP